ncbi:hypothetical protein FQN50_003440 [Emmonsiellopsis sp. PD_5]|nr:hypothetical protein FQN50_003440 [Emmonsiellopsis sp. PD_5]
MSRWHERACRRPDVGVLDGIPCCNYCFAIPSLEDSGPVISLPQPPRLRSRSQIGLAWPPAVSYRPDNASGYDRIQSPRTVATSPQIPVSDDDRIADSVSKSPFEPSMVFPKITSDDTIRLLRLRPGQNDDPIHADIEVVRLGDSQTPTPSYEAVSYTWADETGDDGRHCPVFIGQYWDVVYVTNNCNAVLKTIRHYHVDRTIWIDCLCIDQDCVDDKMHQTGLMREIYTNASGVIAYLGAASADSDSAIDSLKGSKSDRRTAQQSLFQRPYFSRLWAIQEVVLAKRLELLCGRQSVPWLNHFPPAELSIISPGAPSWLIDMSSWSKVTGQNLLRLLIDTSSYKCSDPRDKVFGLLGLVQEQGLTPDYSISVEDVYTGIAAYIIKHHRNFDIFGLASTGKSAYALPSWVPDFSQKLVPTLPETVHTDSYLDGMEVLAFDFFLESRTSSEQLDISNGTLQISAVKLCDVSGKVIRSSGHSKVMVEMGGRGILIVKLLGQTYECTESDSLFILNGWNHPVLLRRCPNLGSYSLISPCALSFGQPALEVDKLWLLPWGDLPHDIQEDVIKISSWSSEEINLIRDIYFRLLESIHPGLAAPSEDPFSVISARILDFYRLSSKTQFPQTEEALWNAWTELDKKLHWMFLDQAVLWKFMKALETEEYLSGTGKMQLPDDESVAVLEAMCGVKFPSTYDWDLGRFCSSFIHTPIPSPGELERTWSPFLDQLKSHLTEIRHWAMISEQLLKVLEYSRLALDRSWDSFPGTQLPGRWLSNGDNSDHGAEGGLYGHERVWNWAEFKDSLRLRESLWNQRIHDDVNPPFSYNLSVRAGLRLIGVDLDTQMVINIV